MRGLSLALGLNAGLAFSTVLDELGQEGMIEGGDEATSRVVDDYRILNDPPDRRFNRLAKPRAAKRPAVPSCAAIPSAERAPCAGLRAAELAMLGDSARAGAITGALLVTIDRDSSAIRAHDYAAAQRQFVHFESLHRELRRALKAEGAGGARVATILRSMGASGALSSVQSAAAIGSVTAKLKRAGVAASKLAPLAKGALEARPANALEALASPTG